MPVYQYKKTENSTYNGPEIMDVECPRDKKSILDADMKLNGYRPFYGSVQFGTVMHAHYNPTTGTVISDMRQFQSDLDRQAEKVEEQTGIPTKYVPVDLKDTASLGVTDEGLQATADAGVRVAKV